jgi:hypothetical protein
MAKENLAEKKQSNQIYIDGLLDEISRLKKEYEQINNTNHELLIQFEYLAMDLTGVSCLVGGLVNLQDMSTELFTNSCRVLSRSIEDIVSSMEATVSGDHHYVGA